MDQTLLMDYSQRQRLLDVFEGELRELLDWLSSYTVKGQSGVTRLLYTKEWYEGQHALEARMVNSGLVTYFDDVGNLYGKLQGKLNDISSVVTGSHIDTVVQGGKYDGAYGIIGGLIAVNYLQRTYGQPKRNIEIVSLCEEEGSRFPIAYWGSGSIVGKRDYRQIEGLKDREGILFSDAMHACGFGEGSARKAARSDIGAFIELHIEQGGVLEQKQLSIGIVDTIVGQCRLKFQINGEPNHAGTTPMYMRRDALEGASAMIRWLRDAAIGQGQPLVATVGSLEVYPNVSNVVPGQVIFTVDIRHSDEQELDLFRELVIDQFAVMAKERDLDITYWDWFYEKPAPMDKDMNSDLARICEDMDIDYQQMVSGAGHDAQMFHPFCPTSLIFVPSRGGISHSPEEYSDLKEMAIGVIVLSRLLYKLGYE